MQKLHQKQMRKQLGKRENLIESLTHLLDISYRDCTVYIVPIFWPSVYIHNITITSLCTSVFCIYLPRRRTVNTRRKKPNNKVRQSLSGDLSINVWPFIFNRNLPRVCVRVCTTIYAFIRHTYCNVLPVNGASYALQYCHLGQSISGNGIVVNINKNASTPPPTGWVRGGGNKRAGLFLEWYIFYIIFCFFKTAGSMWLKIPECSAIYRTT